MAFAIAGFASAAIIVDQISRIFAATLGSYYPYDMIRYVEGDMQDDVLWLLTFIVPILIAEYLILIIPIATIFLFANRIARVRTYEQSIVPLGVQFGAMRMIKRAVIPALFSLSIGQLVYGLVADYLFNQPVDDLTILPMLARQWYGPLTSIVAAVIVVPVTLGFFMPTWVLNDAGIVTKIKPSELEARRCPDTIGVGRWYSNFLTGFTIITVPITSIVSNFYVPLVNFGWQFNEVVLRGFISSVGLPLLTIAFILPMVVFHEMIGSASKRAMQRIARRMGVRDVDSSELVI
ncbi:MAG: hypothetical protein JSW61_05790 [Candidatus Thorarchaeota archaeon]|nr:MAG: hypothetical protein JSW61_05790 [Candidatus Thorarchaeota archaeon]